MAKIYLVFKSTIDGYDDAVFEQEDRFVKAFGSRKSAEKFIDEIEFPDEKDEYGDSGVREAYKHLNVRKSVKKGRLIVPSPGNEYEIRKVIDYIYAWSDEDGSHRLVKDEEFIRTTFSILETDLYGCFGL